MIVSLPHYQAGDAAQPASAPGDDWKGQLGWSFVLLAVTLFQLNDILSAIRRNLDKLVEYGPQIFSGLCFVKAYRSRLLGPALQVGLEQAGFSRHYAFILGLTLLLVLLNASFIPLRRAAGALPALLFFMTFSAIWPMFVSPDFFYLWDLIDLWVFVIFAFIVMGYLPERGLLLLFPVALLNRESAAFIGLWLVILAVLDVRGRRRRFIWGGAMIGVTIIFTAMMREILPIRVPTQGAVLGGNMFQLPANLSSLPLVFAWPLQLPLLAGLGLCMLGLSLCVLRGALRPLALFALALLVFNLTFGVWSEFRIYQQMTPVLALLAIRLALGPDALRGPYCLT